MYREIVMKTVIGASRCHFPQCGIIASVAVLHGDQSRIRGVTPPESNPRTSSGGVGQGFRAALTAREGHQSRTAP